MGCQPFGTHYQKSLKKVGLEQPCCWSWKGEGGPSPHSLHKKCLLPSLATLKWVDPCTQQWRPGRTASIDWQGPWPAVVRVRKTSFCFTTCFIAILLWVKDWLLRPHLHLQVQGPSWSSRTQVSVDLALDWNNNEYFDLHDLLVVAKQFGNWEHAQRFPHTAPLILWSQHFW